VPDASHRFEKNRPYQGLDPAVKKRGPCVVRPTLSGRSTDNHWDTLGSDGPRWASLPATNQDRPTRALGN
jgi:hypothetical protein